MIYELSKYFYKIAKEHFVFSHEALDNLKTLEEKEEYLKKFFPILGTGGKRKTFLKNSKKVIKLIILNKARNDNRIEAGILQNNQSIWLPKFYNRAKDFSWIEVELVRPLKGSYEIDELIGMNGGDFLMFMEDWHKKSNLSIFDLIKEDINSLNEKLERLNHSKFKTEYMEKHFKKEINRYESYLSNEYLKELQKLISTTHLDPWEFAFVFNLGKSASGNLVLLDLGKIL